MKKDKEWLLRELEKIPHEFQDGYLKAKAIYVLPLIDQLDESEITEEQALNKLVEKLPMNTEQLANHFNRLVMHGGKVTYGVEPEKVVIPQYVADWWERDDDSVTLYGGLSVGKKSKLYLISKFYDMGLGDYLSKVEDWLDENDSIFLDLVNGKPYEVEKEPLYLIRFSDDQYALKDYEGGIRSILVFKTYASQFTGVEIDKLGIEYWGFVTPVEENK